ncbi:hypothetical protein FHS55_003258 [Angulomicrobium tetraedrale]|uniref:Uncharacterized protein n=1 Tax=Ancylobacter tetraedralis TaxID=217068 RepID=A0A839ZD70_9HYPH|nr:hypothetical protein [Ancylobacter tetraedralis]MBB3772637.1 hypothetical protein [Ancylobacter tetraedralis]
MTRERAAALRGHDPVASVIRTVHTGPRGIVAAALMKYYLNKSRVDAFSAANRPEKSRDLGGLFEGMDCPYSSGLGSGC